MISGPARLLLDQMFQPRLAEMLVSRGIDSVAVAADPLLRGADDEPILESAIAVQRTLVTNNVADFEPIRVRRASEGRAIPPIIYTSDARFPRDRPFVGRLVHALEHAARARIAELHGGVVWLAPLLDDRS